MAEVKRLIKVAKELNVSSERIIEFLAKQGHELEKNPNAKISPEQMALLEKEFEQDKHLRQTSMEAQEEMNKKREDVKQAEQQKAEQREAQKKEAHRLEELRKETILPIKPLTQEKNDSSHMEEHKKGSEAQQPIQEKNEMEQAATPKESEIIRARKEERGLHVLGNIDVSGYTREGNRSKMGKDTKEKLSGGKNKDQKSSKENKPQQKDKNKQQPENPQKSQPKDFPKKEEKKEEKKVIVPEIIEPEKYQTQYSRLSGPKVVGDKIDLTLLDKPKKTAKEKEEEKKRKRIKKDGKPKEGKSTTAADPKKHQGAGAGKGNNNRANDRHKGGKKNEKPVAKAEPTEEEIQKQVRETLAKLQGKSEKSKGVKYRKEKRDSHRQKAEEELAQQERESSILKITEFVTVNELSTLMDVPVNKVIGACMSLGIFVTMNQRLDAETLTIVADEFGYQVEFSTADIDEAIPIEEDAPEDLLTRAPIVTVMGHVDHGKTSLLDYIRKTNVIAGESGGITQHIGAYSVTLDGGQHITFLDTPGHEAFTAMRARGARITDIAIIVVAADDDIMPQTKEAISHAQAAGVPIIFAINKIDKPTANPEKIKERLAGMNLLVEDWGGKIQSHDISAKQGIGVKDLLEKVLLEAEMLDLKSNPNKKANGTVVEAFLDKGRGYVSTVLVQEGTLKVGDYVLAGTHSGKIRAMHDERGKSVKKATPSTPISILGLDGAPQAGDKFYVFEDEKEAKQIAAKRTQLLREQSVRAQKHITLAEIGRRIALGGFKQLNIILKGDVDGSVEALTDSFQKLSTEEIQISIIHKGVGAITESDVLLASASDAIIVGFNVRPMTTARTLADKEEIDIRTYSIIYDAINDLRDAMEGMLSPVMKEEILGTVEIRELFKISKVGTIAGCMVTDGKILRNSKIRIIRENVVIYTGELASLKRFKDDVKEVSKGYDCGLQIRNYNDIKEGDVIESYQEVAVKKKL